MEPEKIYIPEYIRIDGTKVSGHYRCSGRSRNFDKPEHKLVEFRKYMTEIKNSKLKENKK